MNRDWLPGKYAVDWHEQSRRIFEPIFSLQSEACRRREINRVFCRVCHTASVMQAALRSHYDHNAACVTS